MAEEPDWAEINATLRKSFEEMSAALKKGLDGFHLMMCGGEGLNWMLQGKLAAAKATIEDLSPDGIRALSLAYFGMSQLCDEILAEKGIEPE